MAHSSMVRDALVRLQAKEVHRLFVRLQAKDPPAAPSRETVMEAIEAFASQMALLDQAVFQYHRTLALHVGMHGLSSVLTGGASLDCLGSSVSPAALGYLQGGGNALMRKSHALVAYLDTPSLDTIQ